MPGIVADIALENGTGLVDFARMIEDSSPDGMPGEELFLDHVHPSIESNRMMALAIIDELIEMGFAAPASTWDDAVISQITERVESNVDEAANAMALTNLARVLNWAGKQEEAMALVERARSITADPHTLFGTVAMLMAAGRYEEALPDAEEAARLTPEVAAVRRAHGYILAQLGRNREALEELRAAARLDPTMKDLYYHLGLVLSDLGYQDEAERTYRKGLELEPEDADALNNLGILLAQRGDLAGAMELFNRAVEADPEHLDARGNLERVKGMIRR
jgi:tetratricopeptide (TPR) repeat protein